MSTDHHFEEHGGRDYSADRSQRHQVRRPDASRRRSKPPVKARGPGGIRQRRNKHWNW